MDIIEFRWICFKSKKSPHYIFKTKILTINLGRSNVTGINSFNRCKGLDDSYFPGLRSRNHSSERFSTWVFEEVVDVSLISEVHSRSLLRWRWGKQERRKGNADKGIWTKCCRMLEMIRCPCHGAVTEVLGENGK